MSSLTGKVSAVLGAAGKGNMAQVIADTLHREGASIVVAGRNKDELDRFAKEVNGLAVYCDTTSKEDIKKVFYAAVDKFDKVDIVVNATGWGS